MGKTLQLVIIKSVVYEGVSKTSEYIGLKSSMDGALFEKIALTDENSELLDDFWTKTISSFMEVTDHYLQTGSETSYQYKLDYVFPDNWPDTVKDPFKKTAQQFFVTSLLYDWLSIVAPESAAKYEQDAQSLLYNIKKIIYKRERPARPKRFDEQ